jgi:Glyoxalase/Bleomycin resistance protein/Dioxygenase superfamily
VGRADETVIQHGYVVRDLDASLAYWQETMRAGPFFLVDNAIEGLVYRGQATAVTWTTALTYCGDMLIEIIRQNDESPSIYREQLDATGPGFHHFMLKAPNFDETLERFVRFGAVPAFGRLSSGDERFMYLDTRATLGCFVELYDMRSGTLDLFRQIREAHEKWDGRDPVRAFSSLYSGKLQ